MTPTRSQVENWDTGHLEDAAHHWSKTATVWEDHFTQYATQVATPGGTPWEGDAAEAAQQRAHSDRLVVVGLADQLHHASKVARRGAGELQEACRLVRRSAEAAEADGFTVGEDFSVTDHHVYSRAAAAFRQAKAEGYAADLRALVADLMATDARIASELTASTAGLGKELFAESGEIKAGPEKFDWIPDGTNRAFMGAGLVVDGTTDTVRQRAVKAMKEGAKAGPGKASPALMAFLDDAKVAGRTVKGISGVGGLMSAVMVVPNAISDHGQGDSWLKAFGKEGGGTVTGIAAGAMAGAAFGSAAPVVGTVAGLLVGGVVGYLATEGLDTHWEGLADAVGSAVGGVESSASAVGNAVSGAVRGIASVFSFG